MDTTHLGPYQIESELGSGGMGKVYAAIVEGRCPGLDEGTRVALKVVHPHLLETEGFFKRFLREAEIGKTVRHPNVVRTYDCDAVGGQHFMAMEYVEGQTLRELLDELEWVPEELCRHIAREVCKGLAAIHDAGVIHRDMKPDNVLITGDHVVKVMDLGVARLADEQLRLSQTGAFVGSIHYAAPESFRDGGKTVDGRADLHALGLVLYELACGTNPYLADDVPKTLQKVLHEEPRRLGDLNPQLSPFFEEVVHCLLAKDADERFADANELLCTLEGGEGSTWWHRRASMIRTATKRPLRRVRISRETAVYGREDELTLLRSLFERASAGEGQVLLIEGEAGIGKSRLVDEFIGRLQREDLALNFLFGSYPPGGAATADGGISTAYREQFGAAGCADYLIENAALVPAFDAVLRGEGTPSGVEPLEKGALQTCFVTATRALAQERVTVVLVDDLHFAPDEGRALFTSLAMGVPGHRVLLIGSVRPGVPEEWLAGLTRLDHVGQLEVARLGPKDLGALLEDAFGSASLAEELGYKIVTKSDGNPFFVFEIIRGLREGELITRAADGTWGSTDVIDEIQIPSSILDLVNARVADLSEQERDLLDIACCAGFEFDPLVVGEVLGVERIPLLKRLGQIERRTRLVRSAGLVYRFDHHQVQEALYGSLSGLLRREYHAALGDALAARGSETPGALEGSLCVAACEHFLAGGRPASAVRYLAAAQAHLIARHLNADVVALTERALAAPGALVGRERVRSLVLLTSARGPLTLLGRRAQQEQLAREALQIADELDDDDARVAASRALGNVLWLVSRHDEAEAVFRVALDICRRSGDSRNEAALLGALGSVLVARGELSAALAMYERNLELSKSAEDRRMVATAMCNIGTVHHSRGDWTSAETYYRRHLETAVDMEDLLGQSVAYSNLGLVLTLRGRVDEALECHEQALDLARAVGDRRGQASAVGHIGGVLHARFRFREAEEHHERHLQLSVEIGDRLGEATAVGNLGTLATSVARLDDARRAHVDYLARSREIGYPSGEAVALHNLGNHARETGDTEAALSYFAESLAVCTQIGNQFIAASAELALGSVHADSGDVDAAEGWLIAALQRAREHEFGSAEALALCELARLPGGDSAAAATAVEKFGSELRNEEPCEVYYLLWLATRDRAHLKQARGLLDASTAHVNDETRAAMLTTLRINRAVMTAWRAEFGEV